MRVKLTIPQIAFYAFLIAAHVCALAVYASAQANPPTEIRRGTTRVTAESGGSVKLNLPAGKAVKLTNSCTGAALSASGELSFCYDNTTTPKQLKISFNGGAYIKWYDTAGGTAGGIAGSTGATDNAILRADGTGGATLQNSSVTIDDSGNIATGATSFISFGANRFNYVDTIGPRFYDNNADVAATFNLQSLLSSRVYVWQNLDGTVALTANNLGVFGATTSAQLAAVLSDETGSGGGFVRATSPTLTTPTLGVASATSVTSGKYFGSGSAPSCAVGATARVGTGATCTVSGNDSFAQVTLTTGTGSLSEGTNAFTLTFSSTFTNAPVCGLTFADPDAAAYAISGGAMYITTTATTVILNLVGAGLPTSTEHVLNINCGGK